MSREPGRSSASRSRSGSIAGVLSGLFGVGGGIVMTPGIQVRPRHRRRSSALATPLPVVFPTAISGALRYRRDGEVDVRAAGLMAPIGLPAAVVGALADRGRSTTDLLLLVTAGAARVAVGRHPPRRAASASAAAPVARHRSST